MREMRDPQNGCQIGPVPLCGYNLCMLNKDTITSETIRCIFQQLQRHPKVKVGAIKCVPLQIIVITQYSWIVFFIKHYNSAQTYPLNSYWLITMNQGKIPQYGLCLLSGPINRGMFFNYCRLSKWVCFRILDTHIRA